MSYQPHSGESTANHKNIEHLNEIERDQLRQLTSPFEDIMKGIVGDN